VDQVFMREIDVFLRRHHQLLLAHRRAVAENEAMRARVISLENRLAHLKLDDWCDEEKLLQDVAALEKHMRELDPDFSPSEPELFQNRNADGHQDVLEERDAIMKALIGLKFMV
jgi:hypothetical protein